MIQKIIGVIPARFKSTRLPGKTLVKLLGKLNPDEDTTNINIPKVVANEMNDMIYMSR